MITIMFYQEYSYNDYAEGIIEPREFYKMLYFLLKVFQVLDGPIPQWTYFVRMLMLFCAFTALTIASSAFYHGLDMFDIPFMTEAGLYIIIFLYKLLTFLCVKLHLPDIHCLQRTMRQDFLFICTTGEKYREKFFRNQIQTRKIFKFTVIFFVAMVIAMNFASIFFLLYYLLTHEFGEGKRPLLFPFWWFGIDFGKTPTYEIAFMFANITVLAYGVNYSFMIGTQIVWVRQIACKADIVMWCIKDVLVGVRHTNNERERKYFDNLIRQRMKEVVQHHNSMNTLIEQFARVYKKLLMFEQILSAPVVCLCSYSAAEKWEEGEINAVLLLILVAAIILLFIPSYLCTYLSIKITSISYACWNIPFWKASSVIRPYLLLIMKKSLRPLPLRAPGFEEFSLQTFSNKMASAYSYFNMLRQANRK